MTVNTDKTIEKLRQKITDYPMMEPTPERHIFLLSIITRATTLMGGDRPVLVGGGAVEFYACVRFATGDLDIIAPDTEITGKALDLLGFELPEGSKHYMNRSISALVEIHSDVLHANEEPIELVYNKVPLLVVSPEDCIAKRLKSYKRHSSTLDILNAFLISFHQRDRIDETRIAKRIGDEDLWDFYRPVQDISRALVINDIGTDEAAAALIQFMKKGESQCGF
ncbi:hypothetical protein KAU08_01855 [bacterium]|nr:hypothetical protein [bacterium]